ncbi:MAG TPA: group I intron-associated PD-(D/E)XK endonuclease [Pyrinomonadaceae bacterium]
MIAWQGMSSQQKGKIAEAAIFFRLTLHGFNIYTAFSDGDKTDWLVAVPETGKILKLQVKCANVHSHGLLGIQLTCAEGYHKRRRYKQGEFDFIIGYYLYNDTAYVFSFDELINHRTKVAISEQYAERWDKLRT